MVHTRLHTQRRSVVIVSRSRHVLPTQRHVEEFSCFCLDHRFRSLARMHPSRPSNLRDAIQTLRLAAIKLIKDSPG